jgi:hypothetical protein
VGKGWAFSVALLLMLSTLTFSVPKVGASYYYNFGIEVVPALPNMHDDVVVTVHLETACINYRVNFSALTQAVCDFFAVVDVCVPQIGLPAIGYAEEAYAVGTLASGSYAFHVTVRVWADYARMLLLESRSYVEAFTVQPWSSVVPDDYPTIQAAVNHAVDGDTIFVRNGTYCEHVVVNRSVTLVGDRGGAVVDGGGTGDIFQVTAHAVTVRGFSLRSATNGVHLLGSNGSHVGNNIIEDIHVGGVVLEDSCNSLVDANVVHGAPSIGIAVVWGSERNVVRRNEVTGSHDYGLNVVANSNLIIENLVADCAAAFNVVGVNNTIYHNNAVGNAAQVIGGELSVWDNGCEGNYWSNYNGTDLDGDGVGETYLPWAGVDYYPLMNPYWSPGDIDHDLDVDLSDIFLIAATYHTTPFDPHWNPHCDIACPYQIVDLFDVVTAAGHYGHRR